MPKKPDFAWKWLAIAVLTALLLGVRALEDRLFYDPFLTYFKNDYLGGPLPAYHGFDLFCGLALRYFLNTIFSLGIIYLLFLDKPLLKLAAVLYLFFFVVLVAGFFALLHFESRNAFLIFYTRRFLIQPLFLLLFVPAFYYQSRSAKK